jgi:hypothetical protein
MNQAIFEFYEGNKFRLGTYVQEWGNPVRAGYLDEVFDALSYDAFLSTQMILAIKRFSLFLQVSKMPSHKNPFPNQLNRKGEPEYPLDLYWFRKMGEKRLIKHGLYATTKYQFFMGKKKLKLVVKYNGMTNVFEQEYSKINYRDMFAVVVNWAFELDKELADCDCLN